jgi:glycosyltransferase involved in cell wall biosynthesis
MRSIRAWVAVSQFARDRLVEAGLPRDRVFALRHFWRPRISPAPMKDDDCYLFLGRLIPEKGVATLIDAWNLLRSRMGARAPGIVICGAGPMEQDIRRAAAQNPLIRFVGTVAGQEKERLLAGCRAVIVPSVWWEPLGLVVYESYEFSKPVLASASGGLMETVLEGQTGLLHQPGDGQALAHHVESMEQDPSARMRMGAAGRQWLEDNASTEAWLKSFRAIAAGLGSCTPRSVD